jgi:uncharacterized protein YqhQ
MKIFKILAIIDSGIIIFAMLQQNMLFLLNSQLAFISSLAITIASLNCYKSIVQKESNQQNEDDDEDKKIKISQSLLVGMSGISTLRLLGYAILIGSFVYLQSKNIFDFIGFFLGLSVVPITAFVYMFAKSGDE